METYRAQKSNRVCRRKGRAIKEYINWPWMFGNGSAGCVDPKSDMQGVIA